MSSTIPLNRWVLVQCEARWSTGGEALFYLRSRGIPLEQSRAMLVAAFAAEVFYAINPASLRDRVAVTFAALREIG